ncbi:MAG: hypothetical protein ACRC6L_08300 [Steroidobacteraceae bacterium]
MSQPNRPSPPAPVTRLGDDWETRALNRVAARVEDLPAVPDEADDFGWEAGVLEKLRQRLNATD